MKQPLTVIVPCKNEQLNIRACIESFYSIADEILIADSGSTDATMEIARQFENVKIIERDYRTSGDFKNWAIPQATNEWVLIVDADERIKPELADEIVMCLSRGPEFDGYWIYRENHFLGHPQKYGDARTDCVLRLFKGDRGRYFGPSDHGEIKIDSGSVGKLSTKMEHYSAWNYDQLYNKNDRYTKLQAQQWCEQGKDATYFKLLVGPAWRFFREFILQGSILDGKVGLQTAWIAAFYSFNKQAQLWAIKHGREQQDIDAVVFREMAAELVAEKDPESNFDSEDAIAFEGAELSELQDSQELESDTEDVVARRAA